MNLKSLLERLISPDYTKDAAVRSREEIISYLFEALPFSNDFNRYQITCLLKDDEYLILEKGRLEEWVEHHHQHAAQYRKSIADCEDLEYLFRADRVRGRIRHGFGSPEAMGGIAYWSKTLGNNESGRWVAGFHFASWAICKQDGIFHVRIYQPQSRQWQDVRDEILTAMFVDS